MVVDIFQFPAQSQLRSRDPTFFWEKLNRGVSKPGGVPLFSGAVQIVSRTLSGLFLVGALKRPRKRKKTNRENFRDHPRANRENPEKIGKVPKRKKRTKKEGQVQIGKHPRLKPLRLAALDFWAEKIALRDGCVLLIRESQACTNFGMQIQKKSGNTLEYGPEKAHEIWHVNNFLVTPVTDPSRRVPGRKCLFSLGSAHSAYTFDPWPPGR